MKKSYTQSLPLIKVQVAHSAILFGSVSDKLYRSRVSKPERLRLDFVSLCRQDIVSDKYLILDPVYSNPLTYLELQSVFCCSFWAVVRRIPPHIQHISSTR